MAKNCREKGRVHRSRGSGLDVANMRRKGLSFACVVVSIILSVAKGQGTEDSHQDERQLANKVQAFGANPVERYPLAHCQGDCDLDSHCRGRMICFQRTRYQPVPGCEGGRQDRSPSDYCIDPLDLTVTPQLNFLGINPSRQEFLLQGESLTEMWLGFG